MDTKAKRPEVKAHDEAPSGITDHPFRPKKEWFTLCGVNGCNRAQAAHAETTTFLVNTKNGIVDAAA